MTQRAETIAARRDYFRRDQQDGISAPDLSKACTFAEHIVHARGKRTQLTSISLDLSKIRDFGDTNYRIKYETTEQDGHNVVEHELLIVELRRAAREEQKAERQRAVQAIRYAGQRKEGLVQWRFNTDGVARKDLIEWARLKVQPYFTRIS